MAFSRLVGGSLERTEEYNVSVLLGNAVSVFRVALRSPLLMGGFLVRLHGRFLSSNLLADFW